MCPKQGRGVLPKTNTSSRKETRLHSNRLQMSGSCPPHPQLKRRKESLWWFPEQVCILVSKRDLNSVELETIRISRSPTTVNGQRRGAPYFRACVNCSSEQVMESLLHLSLPYQVLKTISRITLLNPLLDLLSEQSSSVFVLYVEEVQLAKIALSCHFALDVLCYKEGAYDST